MDPELLRSGLRLGVLVTLLAALTLPFQDPRSATFVVDALALAIGLAFCVAIALVARREQRDTAPSYRYKMRNRTRGREE